MIFLTLSCMLMGKLVPFATVSAPSDQSQCKSSAQSFFQDRSHSFVHNSNLRWQDMQAVCAQNIKNRCLREARCSTQR